MFGVDYPFSPGRACRKPAVKKRRIVMGIDDVYRLAPDDAGEKDYRVRIEPLFLGYVHHSVGAGSKPWLKVASGEECHVHVEKRLVEVLREVERHPFGASGRHLEENEEEIDLVILPFHAGRFSTGRFFHIFPLFRFLLQASYLATSPSGPSFCPDICPSRSQNRLPASSRGKAGSL